MIISVERLRESVTTDKTDTALNDMLEAVELLIRKRTNNNFQKRTFRKTADIVGGLLNCPPIVPFRVGDTVQISESSYNDGLYTIAEVTDSTITLNEEVYDEKNVLVTLVKYPKDVQLGVIEIISWKLKNEAENSNDTSKKNIASETISRHSVTYVQDASETDIDADFGVPKKYLAFLTGHKKARFE